MLENFLAYKPLNALSARKVLEACSYKWKILKSLEAKNGSTKPGITTSITFLEWRIKILLDAFKSFTVSVYGLIDATFFHPYTHYPTLFFSFYFLKKFLRVISIDLSSNHILIAFSCRCLTIIKLKSLFMGQSPIINLVCFLAKRKKEEISINLLKRSIFTI